MPWKSAPRLWLLLLLNIWGNKLNPLKGMKLEFYAIGRIIKLQEGNMFILNAKKDRRTRLTPVFLFRLVTIFI